ncbi:MAG: hypothetical protein ACRYFS_22025 [Janthinobacterium lividum]
MIDLEHSNQPKLNAYTKFVKEVNTMPRNKPNIHIEFATIPFDGTEADLRRWVRGTEILLQAKARQLSRLSEFQTSASSFQTIQPLVLEKSASLTLSL